MRIIKEKKTIFKNGHLMQICKVKWQHNGKKTKQSKHGLYSKEDVQGGGGTNGTGAAPHPPDAFSHRFLL